jgi:hypothetical protein
VYYRLDGKKIVALRNALEWAIWFGETDRHIAHDTFGHEGIGVITVSTVFLGLDHRFAGDGPPILFETLVFGGIRDGEMWRCSTWDEAEAQHRMVVDMLKNEIMAALRELSGA